MTAPSSLAERAYVDLREEIIGVRLRPGRCCARTS